MELCPVWIFTQQVDCAKLKTKKKKIWLFPFYLVPVLQPQPQNPPSALVPEPPSNDPYGVPIRTQDSPYGSPVPLSPEQAQQLSRAQAVKKQENVLDNASIVSAKDIVIKAIEEDRKGNATQALSLYQKSIQGFKIGVQRKNSLLLPFF